MKYCSRNLFTSTRLPEPATDQILFASSPKVQWPGWVSRTIDGPNPSFPCPRNVFVAVGNWMTGPTPQINFPGFFGDMKNVGTMSPKPYSPVSGVLGALGTGCQTMGAIQRTSRFQSLEMLTGMTGWMFRT